MMMYGHSHDRFDKEYLKYCLNAIYGSDAWAGFSIKYENERLKAENESLKAKLQKLEKKVETYAFDIEWSHDMKLKEALSKQHDELERDYMEAYDELERDYMEAYSMFEKRCKKYAEELAHTKADLAQANLAIKQLTSILANTYSRKDAGEDECKTEVQKAKEENRAARESKDTD
jgi:hypothetical protein